MGKLALRIGLLCLAALAAGEVSSQPARGEMTEQQRLRAASPGGPITPVSCCRGGQRAANPLDAYTPVTDALLANPSPNDWLSWRRTQDGLGFSPLKSIDKDNVSQLRLAWSLALPPGPNAATPLVHDGVIYVHSFGDNVQALDAATGDELWHYARKLPSNSRPTVKRNHRALRRQGLLRHVGRARGRARREDRRGRLGHADRGPREAASA